MVQIGNEKLTPVSSGRKAKAGGRAAVSLTGWRGCSIPPLTGLKENLKNGEQVKIMLHLAEGANGDTFRWWFDEITKRNVPFDVIGLSMYTYWNGPISALQANMRRHQQTLQRKDVIVVEAAYAYTLANCDNAENSFQEKEEKAGGYPGTDAGAV